MLYIDPLERYEGKKVYYVDYEIRRDYDGLDQFSIVNTFKTSETKGFEPFPGGTTFSTGKELQKIILHDQPNRAIRHYACKLERLDGSQCIVVCMYLTKLVENEYKEIEEIVQIHVPGDIRSSIDDFDYYIMYPYIPWDNPQCVKKVEQLEEKVKQSNQVQDLIRRVLEEYRFNQQVDLEGLLTSEEFKYILLSDPEYYKSIINFDNKSLGTRFDTVTTLSLLSLYISVISGSCIFDNNSGKAKVLLALIASVPLLANAALMIKRRIEVNKLFEEVIENDNKVGVRNRSKKA